MPNVSFREFLASTDLLRHAAPETVTLVAADHDVYEEESDYFFEDRSDEMITDDLLARLLTFPNVLVTSHQAFLTGDALQAIAEITATNAREYLAGKRGADLKNAVGAR